MNKFRRLGRVDYIDRADVLKVRSTLLNEILNDGEFRPRDIVGARSSGLYSSML